MQLQQSGGDARAARRVLRRVSDFTSKALARREFYARRCVLEAKLEHGRRAAQQQAQLRNRRHDERAEQIRAARFRERAGAIEAARAVKRAQREEALFREMFLQAVEIERARIIAEKKAELDTAAARSRMLCKSGSCSPVSMHSTLTLSVSCASLFSTTCAGDGGGEVCGAGAPGVLLPAELGAAGGARIAYLALSLRCLCLVRANHSPRDTERHEPN